MSAIADETIAGEENAPAGKRLDPGFRRNLIIVGGVAALALVIILFLFLRPSSSRPGPAPRSDVVLGAGQSQTVDNMTPEMKRKLDEKQREEANKAQGEGRTYIPPDPSGATTPVAIPTPGTQPAGPSSLTVGTAPVAQYATGLNGEADTRRREGLERQLASLVGEGASGGVRQRLTADSRGEGGGAAGVRSVSGATGSPQAAASQAKRTLVPGLTIAAAELTSDIKVPSGQQGFASARINSGPAAGGFLIGTAKVTDESLEVTFSQMRLGDSVYKVDAIVLDETTASNAIAGNVDRRLLQRYVLPVALATAQGFFAAKAQTGSTVVSLANSVSGVSTPPPSSEQARSAGIAAGMQIGSQEVQKVAQQPIVVHRERSYPVGILFRAPVTEETQ